MNSRRIDDRAWATQRYRNSLHTYIDAVVGGELTAVWERQVGPVLVDKLTEDRWNRTTIEEPWSEKEVSLNSGHFQPMPWDFLTARTAVSDDAGEASLDVDQGGEVDGHARDRSVPDDGGFLAVLSDVADGVGELPERSRALELSVEVGGLSVSTPFEVEKRHGWS